MKMIALCLGLLLASAPSFAQDKDNKYQIVERNRRLPFVVSDSYVKQDAKIIVLYKTEPVAENGTKFTYTLPNGTVVAETVVKRADSGGVTVHTMIDGKRHTIGLRNVSEMEIAREIAMFLSDHKYI